MNKSDKKGQNRISSLLYAVKSYFSVQANVLIVLFAVLLLVLTVYPIYSVIRSAVTVGRMEAMRYNTLMHTKLSEGDLTILNFRALLTNESTFWKPLWNSLRMSAYASLIAILVGGTFAFLITRTDIHCKKFFSSVFIFPYIMPSWTLALVWKNVFANSGVGTGVVGMLESLTGICVPPWVVYGIFPCALVMGIHYAPFAYILIGGTLRNMDANLEEAATILQASRGRILRKITIPIVMPALFSTVLLVFSSTMASYAVPVFVGSPGNFFVLSTQLSSLYNTMATKGQAFVMTIVLILFGVMLLGINLWFTGKRKSFTTVTGKSGQVSYIKLGKANNIVAAVLVIVLFLIAIFPIISFALESMCEVQGDYSTLTLKYWLSREDIGGFAVNAGHGILFNSMIWQALWGSIKLSLIVSLLVGTCGILIGYAVARKRGTKLAGLVSGLAFFPYMVPSMAFGAIFLAVSTRLTFLRG
ncbi:MAG: iron ABC transporter permease, partial [Clostridia bacterium]|nr:iron ABC transporter permease [Clostridia bacterium]